MNSDTCVHKDLFAAQQQSLRERLSSLLDSLHPTLHADVVLVLGGRGKVLANPVPSTPHAVPDGVWALLTLLVTQHISSEINPLYASTIALATECFACALDLLDDVEDEDQTEMMKALGPARMLNVSTALLGLAQRAILSGTHYGISSTITMALLNEIQDTILIATGGQHQDILGEKRPAQEMTLDECLKIAAAKAGSLTRLACCLGVICAGGDQPEYDQFSELGQLLGIAHQLDNDCHDLYHLLQGEFSTLDY